MRKGRAVKEQYISAEVDKSRARMLANHYTLRERSALGDILQRELNLAKKEGWHPQFHS